MTTRFVFVAPMYNAENYLRQFVMSLAVQTHTNWHLIVIDDVSTDRSCENLCDMFTALGMENMLTLIRNNKKMWEVANVLQGIRHLVVKDDDVICRIDPDDYLCDVNCLEILNMMYNNSHSYEAVWTGHRWFDDRGITMKNISGELADGANPYAHPWVSSHLKTFRKCLINGINEENFKGPDGEYIRRAGDQAIYLPVLHKAKKRAFLPIQMYAYRCNMRPETFQTDDAKFQAAEAEFIRRRGFVQ